MTDVRLALRSLRAQPGSSILAGVALALGIGLTTTMFCLVDGIFLRGLPFERAGRLLYVGEQPSRLAERRPRDLPANDYLEWRAAQQSFEASTSASTSACSRLRPSLAASRRLPRALRRRCVPRECPSWVS